MLTHCSKHPASWNVVFLANWDNSVTGWLDLWRNFSLVKCFGCSLSPLDTSSWLCCWLRQVEGISIKTGCLTFTPFIDIDNGPTAKALVTTWDEPFVFLRRHFFDYSAFSCQWYHWKHWKISWIILRGKIPHFLCMCICHCSRSCAVLPCYYNCCSSSHCQCMYQINQL